MKTLDQWLASFNEHKIDLGLDRVKAVLARPPFANLKARIVTVGGTNGKGSTVTAVASLLQAAGQRVGVFTSPHIFRYNERIQVNGYNPSDDTIAAAFSAIDAIRDDIPLSYFEYSLLAALFIFQQQQVDFMVLEVGLGGRLDAVNALDSDVSIITTVDIDHSHWLGHDIETIAAEKAAIMRSGRVMVYGDVSCPKAISLRAREQQVRLVRWQHHFSVDTGENVFSYVGERHSFTDLPRPLLPGEFQLRNFATALTAVLNVMPTIRQEMVVKALKQWRIPGRIQRIQDNPEVIVDVAHNRQSVQSLCEFVLNNPAQGVTRAIFSVLQDKQAETWLPLISPCIDHWFIFALSDRRATDINTLKQQLADADAMLSVCTQGRQAYQHALSLSQSQDRVLVFGSFHVLDEVFQNNPAAITELNIQP